MFGNQVSGCKLGACFYRAFHRNTTQDFLRLLNSETRAKHGNSQFEHSARREAVIGSTTSSELTVGFLSTPKRSRQREGLLRFTSLVLCQILSSAWLW